MLSDLALMLLLTSRASDALGLGFTVSGFWPALFGGLVVSVVSFALSLFVSPDHEGGRGKKKDWSGLADPLRSGRRLSRVRVAAVGRA